DWGDPATDFGKCPGTEARVLRWGQLLVMLSNRSRYGDGREHFAGWRYGPAVEETAFYPDALKMSSGLAPGATLSEIQELYPGAVTVVPANGPVPARFQIGSSFGGWLTGTAADATVTALDAGQPCEPARS